MAGPKNKRKKTKKIFRTDPLARLIYIVEFCKRNYNLKNLTMYGGVSVWNY